LPLTPNCANTIRVSLLQGNSISSAQWLAAHDTVECAHRAGYPRGDVEAGDVSCDACDYTELNSATNVIVLARVQELITMARFNTVLSIASVLYLGVNIVGIILNSYDNDCDPDSPGCSPATTPQIFHNLEFWASFVFNIVDLLAISYSPRGLSNQYANPTFLKMVVLVNVGFSFFSALLVSINLEKFEVPSHEVEYFNELTITIFDAMILYSLVRGRVHDASTITRETCRTIVMLCLAACVASVQLVIYNLSGWTPEGDSKGEQAAHYFEFCFGAASAAVTFWFTMDNKISAEARLRQIIYK
jgi:hypothetical protein